MGVYNGDCVRPGICYVNLFAISRDAQATRNVPNRNLLQNSSGCGIHNAEFVTLLADNIKPESISNRARPETET